MVDLQERARLTTLTGSGRGAVGVLAVWGHGALSVVDAVFRPNRGPSLSATPPGRLRLGRIGRGLGDEVVAVVLEELPPGVEVQCHGGAAALTLVKSALQEAGAEPAEPAEWAGHHLSTPTRAEALVDLAFATTIRAASILLDQAHGSLDRQLDEVLNRIRAGQPAPALDRIGRLLSLGTLGSRLASGWRVVIRGRPNVGKSRLFNTLAGYQRAIVDPTPGTTRDVVGVDVAFDGWPIRLLDTAGVRATGDDLERSGIERTLREAGAADLILQVVDLSEPLQEEDRRWHSAKTPAPTIVVANKADLPAAWALECAAFDGTPAVTVSAKLEEGIDRLIEAVVGMLVPEAPEAGAGVPFRIEHLDSLQAAACALRHGDTDGAIRALELLV